MLDILRKLRKLLDARERRNANILFCLILLMSLLETIGVASLMPFLTVLSNPEIIQDNLILTDMYERLEFNNSHSFLLFLGGVVFAFTILNLMVKIITNWALARFANMRNYSLSSKLLKVFLEKPYIWFLTENSADLHKKILSEVQLVIDQTLIPLLRMISASMVVVFLMCLLIWINPWIAIMSVVVIGGIYIVIYAVLRGYINRIGKERIRANEKRFTVAQESLGGIKQVKALGLEDYCIESFQGPARQYAKHLANSQILGEMPRFVLEAVAIGGMLSIVLILLVKNSSGLDQVIPIIGVYGFAAMRVLPAIQLVYQSAIKLRFSKPSLDALFVDMENTDEIVLTHKKNSDSSCKPLTVKETIELINIGFRYTEKDKPIIKNMNISIKANTIIAFVGSTGAGKTTIIDLIVGLLLPTEGEIRVDGTVIDERNLRQWQKSIGYVPQYAFLSDDTVAANIAYGVHKEEINFESVKRAAKMAEIHEFITKELEHGYETKIGERGIRLSGGQCQRIAFARALYYDPDILVLDEATSALDNNTELSVMSSVYKYGRTKTVILIAHRLSTVERCDTIILMESGEIISSGTYTELMDNSPAFRLMATSNE